MKTKGEIIIIEDDPEEIEIIKLALLDLPYQQKVTFILDSTEAIAYLHRDDIVPFLIISDINMPKLDGYSLRAQISNDPRLKQKCIPFIFLSTSELDQHVIKAYEICAQGYFKKPVRIRDYVETFTDIIKYWSNCLTPNVA